MITQEIQWKSDETEGTWFDEGKWEYAGKALGHRALDINAFKA